MVVLSGQGNFRIVSTARRRCGGRVGRLRRRIQLLGRRISFLAHGLCKAGSRGASALRVGKRVSLFGRVRAYTSPSTRRPRLIRVRGRLHGEGCANRQRRLMGGLPRDGMLRAVSRERRVYSGYKDAVIGMKRRFIHARMRFVPTGLGIVSRCQRACRYESYQGGKAPCVRGTPIPCPPILRSLTSTSAVA